MFSFKTVKNVQNICYWRLMKTKRQHSFLAGMHFKLKATTHYRRTSWN